MTCVVWLCDTMSIALAIRIGPPLAASELSVRATAMTSICPACGRK